MVPLVGTPVVGGGTTCRAAFPDAEYSQMSPPPATTGVALDVEDGAAEVAGGLGAGGVTGIWPQPPASAAAPKIAIRVAPRTRTTVVLCHSANWVPRNDRPLRRV